MDEETEAHAWHHTSDDEVMACTYKIDHPDFPYDVDKFTLRYSYKQDTVSLMEIDNRKVCLNVSVGFIRARDRIGHQAYGELVFYQIENILAGNPVDISNIDTITEKIKAPKLDISNTPIRDGSYISFAYTTKNVQVFKINTVTLSLFCKRCNSLNVKSVGEENCEIGPNTKTRFNCVKCTGQLSIDSAFHLIMPDGSNKDNLMRIDRTGVYNVSIRSILLNCLCSGCSSITQMEIDREMHCPCGKTLIVRKDPARPYKEVLANPRDKTAKTPPKGDVDSLMQKGGTCEHYKKSNRIFIFPCCNGRYPCDVCHNKSETHPAIRATRMICGMCGVESPIGPICNSSTCKAHLTGKKSSFWEGGKGSRNKITMSRKDSKKYSNK